MKTEHPRKDLLFRPTWSKTTNLQKCIHSPTQKKSITFKFKTCICHSKDIYIWDLSEVMLKMDINTPADSTQRSSSGWLPNWPRVCSSEHNTHPVRLPPPSKQQLADRNTYVTYSMETLLNIFFQKGKFILFVFTKSSRNTKDVAVRDSNHNYIDYEDTLNHMKPYCLPQ